MNIRHYLSFFSSSRVRENLFADLERDVTTSLLFLKRINRIRIEEKTDNKKTILRCEARREEDGSNVLIVDDKGRETRFLVETTSADKLKPGPVREELEEMASSLKVPAEVSVAACLSDTGDERFHDRVSVMLPLPILPSTKSGLPVLVNGFFALGESRYTRPGFLVILSSHNFCQA